MVWPCEKERRDENEVIRWAAERRNEDRVKDGMIVYIIDDERDRIALQLTSDRAVWGVATRRPDPS